MSGILNDLLMAGSVVADPATQQAENQKGISVDDLARGLRSAVRNIENDIPKIGPAIGTTVKSIAGTSSAKTQAKDPPSTKK